MSKRRKLLEGLLEAVQFDHTALTKTPGGFPARLDFLKLQLAIIIEMYPDADDEPHIPRGQRVPDPEELIADGKAAIGAELGRLLGKMQEGRKLSPFEQKMVAVHVRALRHVLSEDRKLDDGLKNLSPEELEREAARLLEKAKEKSDESHQ